MMRRGSMKGLCLLPVAVLTMACGQPMEGKQAAEGSGAPLQSEQAAVSPLSLKEQALTSQLESTLEAGNDEHYWTEGYLRAFSFTWSSKSAPTLAQADAAVMAMQEYEPFTYTQPVTLTYAQARGGLYAEFDPLHPLILSTYGNGSETVQVATRYYSRPVAPGSSGWFRLFVILFPQSKKVIVFEQDGFET